MLAGRIAAIAEATEPQQNVCRGFTRPFADSFQLAGGAPGRRRPSAGASAIAVSAEKALELAPGARRCGVERKTDAEHEDGRPARHGQRRHAVVGVVSRRELELAIGELEQLIERLRAKSGRRHLEMQTLPQAPGRDELFARAPVANAEG